MSLGRNITLPKNNPPQTNPEHNDHQNHQDHPISKTGSAPALLCLLAVGCGAWAVGCWLGVAAAVARVAVVGAVADVVAAAAFGGASTGAAGHGVTASGA